MTGRGEDQTNLSGKDVVKSLIQLSIHDFTPANVSRKLAVGRAGAQATSSVLMEPSFSQFSKDGEPREASRDTRRR